MVPFIAMQVAGAGISAVGAFQQGQSQKEAYQQRARIARLDAAAVERATEYETSQMDAEARRLRARQIVQFAKSGVLMQGTPELVVKETKARADEERSYVKERGRKEANKLRMQALYEEQMGASAFQSGLWGAAGSLLGGSASIYKTGMDAGWW